MDTYAKVRDMINCELDEVTKSGSIEPNLAHYIGELVDILKDLDEVEMNGMYDEEGYYSSRMGGRNSYEGGSMRNGSYRGYNYDGGYSRRGSRMNYNRGMYSRDDAKMRMIEKLEHALDDATSQSDRDAIQKLISKMENE